MKACIKASYQRANGDKLYELLHTSDSVNIKKLAKLTPWTKAKL